MKYLNAKDVLPENILRIIQQYADGTVLYIPAKNETKSGWGNKSGARRQYEERNKRICEMYEGNSSCEEIAGRFYLSVASIKKIVKNRQQR